MAENLWTKISAHKIVKYNSISVSWGGIKCSQDCVCSKLGWCCTVWNDGCMHLSAGLYVCLCLSLFLSVSVCPIVFPLWEWKVGVISHLWYGMDTVDMSSTLYNSTATSRTECPDHEWSDGSCSLVLDELKYRLDYESAVRLVSEGKELVMTCVFLYSVFLVQRCSLSK